MEANKSYFVRLGKSKEILILNCFASYDINYIHYRIVNTQEVYIGNNIECEINYGHPFVSKKHARIFFMNNFKIPLHIIAVAGIVINEKNQILMVNSNNYGWAFPGGQVEEGENLINALKREVFEETGIKISVGEVFCISSNTKKHSGYNGIKEIPIVNLKLNLAINPPAIVTANKAI